MFILGQNSNVGKLKTLSGALDIMVRTEHAFQLIQKELVEECDQVTEENFYVYGKCMLRGIWHILNECMYMYILLHKVHY